MEPLTIITKHSILDAAALLDPPLNKTKYLKHVQIGYMIEVSLKKEKIHYFFFIQKDQWFYPSIPEVCGLHKTFQC